MGQEMALQMTTVDNHRIRQMMARTLRRIMI